ncbi:MAG: hypothetical protein CL916_03890 [Deltaproteobacteria bacterium]|nr:hypothetical protein [Deltaproteobacteria bacterium]
MLFSSIYLLSCAPEIPEEAWVFDTIYGIANSDDDNENGESDWEESTFAEENDRSTIIIPSVFFENKTSKQKLRLTQNNENFRLYLNGTLITNSSGDNVLLSLEEPADLKIEVEFLTYNKPHSLTLSLEEEGEIINSTTIEMHSAPILIGHHLQPAELLISMGYRGAQGNQDFVDAFADVLSDQFIEYPLNEYNFDVWIQDEIEFGILQKEDHQTSLIIDSIRNRGLARLSEQELVGTDIGRGVWGSGTPTSQDSFGNLEATPPVLVDGTNYPFGRIYYGKFYTEDLAQGMKDMLDEQVIQSPVELDVSFLCVGHVDEFVTFLPDPTARQGFRMYITDTEKGYEFFSSLSSNHQLPLYQQEYGYGTVGDILSDNNLRALNEEIQATYIEPNIERFKNEFGITEDEIVRVPMLFEEPQGCYGATATLLPGVVNMAVFTHEDQESADAFIPDPFFRSNLSNTSDDPYIEMFESILPEGVTPHWVNDWEWYHVQLGEVHCGSNIKRKAVNNWWEK